MMFKLRRILMMCIVTVIVLGMRNEIYATQNKSIKIEGVPTIKQYPELPTGCEATALTILLRYSGVNVSKEEVANKIPRVTLPHSINGRTYGKHPNDGFIGNPFSKSSYGVYSKPILDTVEYYLPNRGESLTGKGFDEILDVVKKGRPVMIWATINMINVSYTSSWYLEDGSLFKWPNNEHAVVVIGYDDNWVYISDPYSGTEKKYRKEVVANRYNTLGKQAIAILPESTILGLEVDGKEIHIGSDREIVHKDEKIMIPISMMKDIGIETTYYYSNRTVYANIEGIKDCMEIKDNKGVWVGRTDNEEEISIAYEIEEGVTKLSLDDLIKIGKFSYKIQENKIILNTIIPDDIKTDEAIDEVI